MQCVWEYACTVGHPHTGKPTYPATPLPNRKNTDKHSYLSLSKKKPLARQHQPLETVTYTCDERQCRQCSNNFAMRLLRTICKFWNFVPVDGKQKTSNLMNHENALVKLNIQRASNVSNPDCRAAPEPFVSLCLLTVPNKNHKYGKIHASSWHSRGFVIAQALSHHLR